MLIIGHQGILRILYGYFMWTEVSSRKQVCSVAVCCSVLQLLYVDRSFLPQAGVYLSRYRYSHTSDAHVIHTRHIKRVSLCVVCVLHVRQMCVSTYIDLDMVTLCGQKFPPGSRCVYVYKCVCVYLYVWVCVRERECVCMCVCVWERERERERGGRERVCVCVWVC